MTKTYTLRQTLVIAFCLWHMTAVLLYLLPNSGSKIFRQAKNVTRPYILILSQWQKWDIFSPNPVRRVSTFRIEENVGGRWHTLVMLDTKKIPWWQRNKELKVLGRLQEGWNKLAPSYLGAYCRVLGVQNVNLRLVAHSTVVPSEMNELRNYSDTISEPYESIMATLYCPPSS